MCVCAQKTATTTTTEDTPVFDRERVSLDIPSTTFSTGFTLITNISKILNSVILVSTLKADDEGVMATSVDARIQ